MEYQNPVKLSPVCKDYIWGGTKLKSEYHKKSELEIVAESWELSTHKDGESMIASGPYAGMTLSAYIQKIGADALGTRAQKFDYFPLLIKLIDARDNLSVQVHPNDAYALKNEGEYGKTEMWYIVGCEQDAALYYGFSQDVDKDTFVNAIRENTLTDLLNCVPVHKGDVFFIPAGTVHAIGKGIVICEIQQNSNTTYRIYDYGRVGADGKPRALHIEKASEVSTLQKLPLPVQNHNSELLESCDYFTVKKYVIDNQRILPVHTDTFQSITIVEGDGTLSMHDCTLTLQTGDTVFIPAQDGEYAIAGKCTAIAAMI